MEQKIFVKLDHVTAACQDENGKQIVMPLLGKMKIIDEELYCYIEGFLDQYCNKVDEETTKKILEKLSLSIN